MEARNRRRSVAAALVLALGLALAPVALAQPLGAAGAHARIAASPSGVPTWVPDPYDPVDETPGGARPIGAALGPSTGPHGFGKPPLTEPHAFADASNATTPGASDYVGDEDWLQFSVDDFDVASGLAYLIEAKATTATVHPVIEVYGPTTTATVEATSPASVPDGVDPGACAAATSGPWPGGAADLASVSFVPTSAGDYAFRVRPAFSAPASGPAGFGDGAGTYQLRMKIGQVTRIAGVDRIQTAIKTSTEAFAAGSLAASESAGAVVVASGFNYPDALAGSLLCGVVRGPMLLTRAASLDVAVADEVRRLGARRAFVLGGPTTLAPKVVSDLEAVVGTGNVRRVWGSSRVQTAVEIAKAARDESAGAPSKTAFVANCWGYADALSASPVAAFDHAPVFLTRPASLDASVTEAIDELGITDVVILGGPKSVSASVEATLEVKLNAGGGDHVARIAGVDRCDTSRQLAVWATGNRGAGESVSTSSGPALAPLEWRHVGVATGWGYADALGGGVFAGLSGHPLLLTPAKSLSPWILDAQGIVPGGTGGYFGLGPGQTSVTHAARSYFFGGPPTISDGVLWTLDLLAGGQE